MTNAFVVRLENTRSSSMCWKVYTGSRLRSSQKKYYSHRTEPLQAMRPHLLFVNVA